MNMKLTIVTIGVVCLEIIYWTAFAIALLPNVVCVLTRKCMQVISLKVLMDANPALKAMYDEMAKIKKEEENEDIR